MHKFIFSALGIAFFMSSSSLMAQEQSAEDLRKKLIEMYDEDGDGKLNDQEREKARKAFLEQKPEDKPEEQPTRDRRPQANQGQPRRGPGGGNDERRAQFLAVWDKDKDGELSEEERDAMRKEFEQRREAGRDRFMAQYDKDKDGELSDEERQAARDNFEKQREETVKKYDKDNDGELSREEREAMMEQFRKDREELTAKYDANKDGYLSFEEEEKARKDGAEIPNFGAIGFGRGQGGQGGPGGRGPGQGFQGRRGGDGQPGNFRRGGGDGQGRPRRPGGGDDNNRPQRPGNN